MMKSLTITFMALILLQSRFATAQQTRDGGLSFLGWTNILVVRIVEVNSVPTNSEPHEPGMRRVTLTLDQVLKGPVSTPLGGSAVAIISQFRFGRIADNPEFWSDKIVEKAQVYLLFGNAKDRKLAGMFEHPALAHEVRDGDTSVADVAFVLGATQKDVRDQGNRLLSFLQGTERHSRFLGEYAAYLIGELDSLTDPELTTSVMQAVQPRLNDEASRAFLWNVFQKIRLSGEFSKTLVDVFVMTALRDLAAEEPNKQPAIRPEQLEIIQNYIPWMLSSNTAMSAIKEDLFNRQERQNLVASLAKFQNSTIIASNSKQSIADLSRMLAESLKGPN